MSIKEAEEIYDAVQEERKLKKWLTVLDKAFAASTFVVSLVFLLCGVKEQYLYMAVFSVASSVNAVIYYWIRKGYSNRRYEIMKMVIERLSENEMQNGLR